MHSIVFREPLTSIPQGWAALKCVIKLNENTKECPTRIGCAPGFAFKGIGHTMWPSTLLYTDRGHQEFASGGSCVAAAFALS